ncbi:MAG: branched-chain amino acid ABC transporter permease [Rhodomicrobiaceae bacterium]
MLISAIVMDGLVYTAYLFIVAVGLSLIFGVMKILNVAHGGCYAFGAYSAATAVGIYFDHGLPVALGFLLMALSAVLVGALIGVMLERGLLRHFYDRDEITIVLVTYAASLILEAMLILIWGPGSLLAYQPMLAAGNFVAGDLVISNYDIGLVVCAAVIAVLAQIGLNHSRIGRILRAVIHDREMAAAVGINVSRVFLVTFALGAALGALGGALMAPKISVTLGIGVEVIVLAFAVVAIGGMGSIQGAMLGALIVGLSRAVAVHLLPEVEMFVIYAIMALVLAFRPSGLFVRPQPRKI